MAPALFNMKFSVMLMDAFQDCDTGFPIRHRFDGKLFNPRWRHVETKLQTDVIGELFYEFRDKDAKDNVSRFTRI